MGPNESVQWDILHKLCKKNFNSEKVVKGSVALVSFGKFTSLPYYSTYTDVHAWFPKWAV